MRLFCLELFLSWHFFGALRLSEIVPSNKKSCSGLLFHDVLVGDSSVKIFIAKSKTNQLGKDIWLMLFLCSDPAICPVSVICHFLSCRSSSPGQFFLHEDSIKSHNQISICFSVKEVYSKPRFAGFPFHAPFLSYWSCD